MFIVGCGFTYKNIYYYFFDSWSHRVAAKLEVGAGGDFAFD